MSREWKIAVGVGATVLCLCAVACISIYIIGRYTLPKTIASQPDQAAQIGREIVDYTLPPGYSELVGVSLFGTRWVTIASDAPGTLIIMLMQFQANSGKSQEEMQQEMERSLAQQSRRRVSSFEIVGTQKTTINGREVVFTVSEGRGEEDRVLRQVTGVFPGKNGWVMVMVMGEVETWKQDVLDAFLASIR